MKRFLCVALGLFAALAAFSGCREKDGLSEMQTKPGITPLKAAEKQTENPENEVTVDGIRYTLEEDGYAAEMVAFQETVTVQAYLYGLPVKSLAGFSSGVVRKLFLPDTLETTGEFRYLSFQTDLFIPDSVKTVQNFAYTDCPVYFAGGKADFASDPMRAETETFAETMYGVRYDWNGDDYYEDGKRVRSENRYEVVGLGGIYKASCLRFLKDDGTAEKEIPFANAESEIDNASKKLAGKNFKRYRTEVAAEELPQGTWYYLGKNGEKIRFTLDAIDYNRQQIISLYRA